MTERNSQSRVRARRGRRTGLTAAAIAAWVFGAGLPSSAQDGTNRPLPPPEEAPGSRLAVTPSEFERWLSRRPEPDDAATRPEAPIPAIATPPPPPPALIAPPAPPLLAAPPPATLPPAPSAPEAPGLPAPPKSPQTVTVQPESPATTIPQEPILQRVPKPDDLRIVYEPDATDVPASAREDLDGLAAWLAANPSIRIQVRAFASRATATGSRARRLSLLRAREVRRYLIGKGVPETQIDLRALGASTDETPKDRVEISLPSP